MELETLMKTWEITAINSPGIISELYDIYNSTNDEELTIPFIPNEQFSVRLNNYYYFGWSGDKYTSPFVEKYKNLAESPVSWQVEVAKAFWEVHGDELLRQWELFQKEYDPLASYDVHEETGYEHSGSGSVEDSGSDTRKKMGKISVTDSAYGINQNTSADADKSVTEYGEGQMPMQDKLEYGKTRESSESASDELSIHKYGNLGTISLTRLLKDDIEMWQWDFFTKFFFPAIDSMIALPIY